MRKAPSTHSARAAHQNLLEPGHFYRQFPKAPNIVFAKGNHHTYNVSASNRLNQQNRPVLPRQVPCRASSVLSVGWALEVDCCRMPLRGIFS